MTLYQPVKPTFVNQKFGEVVNLAYYQANGINFKGHNGIDFRATHGQPIFASHDGDAFWQEDANLGFGVVIRSRDTFNYVSNGAPMQAYYKTIYWHMVNPDKEPYQSPLGAPLNSTAVSVPVKAGDFIGWADSTGLSTGDHVHFGLKPCMISEPQNTWYNLEPNNGYYGCIDPAPYLSTSFAEDLPLKYQFTRTIMIGDQSAEVVALQRILKQLGLFDHAITGYYGTITKSAVYAFQLKYVAKDWWSTLQVKANGGDAVRSLTRAALNSL